MPRARRCAPGQTANGWRSAPRGPFRRRPKSALEPDGPAGSMADMGSSSTSSSGGAAAPAPATAPAAGLARVAAALVQRQLPQRAQLQGQRRVAAAVVLPHLPQGPRPRASRPASRVAGRHSPDVPVERLPVGRWAFRKLAAARGVSCCQPQRADRRALACRCGPPAPASSPGASRRFTRCSTVACQWCSWASCTSTTQGCRPGSRSVQSWRLSIEEVEGLLGIKGTHDGR